MMNKLDNLGSFRHRYNRQSPNKKNSNATRGISGPSATVVRVALMPKAVRQMITDMDTVRNQWKYRSDVCISITPSSEPKQFIVLSKFCCRQVEITLHRRLDQVAI